MEKYKELKEIINKAVLDGRAKKPGHGTCCTCADCGFYNEECICPTYCLKDVMVAIGKNQEKWRENQWFTWVFFIYEKMGTLQSPWAGAHAYSHDKGWALLSDHEQAPIGWFLNNDDLDFQDEQTKKFLIDLLVC